MNGRAYDYNLGRFLSVDPFIQFPENSQSLNPYSYIMNNPMSGTDPTGYVCQSTQSGEECLDSLDVGEIDAVVNEYGEIIGFVSNNGNGELGLADTNGNAKAFQVKAPSEIGSASERSTGDSLVRQIGDGAKEGAARALDRISGGNGDIIVGVTAGPIVDAIVGVVEGDPQAVGEAALEIALGKGKAVKKIGDGALGRGGNRSLPFNDPERIEEVNRTLDRIESGGPFRHRRDGIKFQNREGRLPEGGDYREYTVDTPGSTTRGARRVVVDQNTGRTFYTDDHYRSFVEIDPRRN